LALSDATVARLSALGGEQGATRSITLNAFSEDEYREMVASSP
jgi:uncharacterized protein with GYD domain